MNIFGMIFSFFIPGVIFGMLFMCALLVNFAKKERRRREDKKSEG